MGYTSDITVRSRKRTDESHWQRPWSAYLRFCGTGVADEVDETTFSRLPDPTGAQWGLIADHDGAPVGLVNHVFQGVSWKIEDVRARQDLCADTAKRGRGVDLSGDKALVEAVDAAACAEATHGVRRMTQDGHGGAGRLTDWIGDRIGDRTADIKYQRGQIR